MDAATAGRGDRAAAAPGRRCRCAPNRPTRPRAGRAAAARPAAGGAACGKQDVADLIRELATMLSAGQDLDRALRYMEETAPAAVRPHA